MPTTAICLQLKNHSLKCIFSVSALDKLQQEKEQVASLEAKMPCVSETPSRS